MLRIEHVCYCGSPVIEIVSEDQEEIDKAFAYLTRKWLANQR